MRTWLPDRNSPSKSGVESKLVIRESRWKATWRTLLRGVECAGADRRGPGSCMPAFSVYGPITSRLEGKINRRGGTNDVSLQPDDRPMRRGRRRPISTEQSISKDIHDVGNSTHVSLFYPYTNTYLVACYLLAPKSNPNSVKYDLITKAITKYGDNFVNIVAELLLLLTVKDC